ncbi:hypothetical protein, partial [Vibrio sp. 10N.286.48.F5]|uniref:hypothetical protein n=1 Tax=Vibrio sp. 10N.286.48.F5 TaxID=3229699 RepID=UPI003551B1C2
IFTLIGIIVNNVIFHIMASKIKIKKGPTLSSWPFPNVWWSWRKLNLSFKGLILFSLFWFGFYVGYQDGY